MNQADTGARTERERIAGILRHELWERHRVGLPQRDVLAIADAVLAALAERTEGEESARAAPERASREHDAWPTVHRYADGGYVWTYCSGCGPDVVVDEDGCCIGCGQDAIWYGEEPAVPPQEAGEPAVPAAEMLTTDANQGWIVEYEEVEAVWLIKPTLARLCYWNKATAKLAARTLARVGYRVRIVPLLRGAPVEIRGDV